MGNTEACLYENSEMLLLKESRNNLGRKSLISQKVMRTRGQEEKHSFWEEAEDHFLHERRKIWTQMHGVGRFCGGKMSEFISNDFYFLNEV
jgi:hypothetical protein